MHKLSVIIGVYNNIEFLRLVLKSLQQQTYQDFEVIIAEDAEHKKVKDFVNQSQQHCFYPITHVSQPDCGFRKNKIYNQAIKIAKYDYIVFIDGDCILHPKFLETYAAKARNNLCLFGRRVELGKKTTKQLLQTGDFKYLSILRLLFNATKRIEDCLYLPFYTRKKEKNIVGCNFCVPKKQLYEINGFDEDFVTPYYGEDTDIRRRLKLLDVQFESTRFKAIVYHLFHDAGDRSESKKISRKIFERKTTEGLFYTKNGLLKKT